MLGRDDGFRGVGLHVLTKLEIGVIFVLSVICGEDRGEVVLMA